MEQAPLKMWPPIYVIKAELNAKMAHWHVDNLIDEEKPGYQSVDKERWQVREVMQNQPQWQHHIFFWQSIKLLKIMLPCHATWGLTPPSTPLCEGIHGRSLRGYKCQIQTSSTTHSAQNQWSTSLSMRPGFWRHIKKWKKNSRIRKISHAKCWSRLGSSCQPSS